MGSPQSFPFRTSTTQYAMIPDEFPETPAYALKFGNVVLSEEPRIYPLPTAPPPRPPTLFEDSSMAKAIYEKRNVVSGTFPLFAMGSF